MAEGWMKLGRGENERRERERKKETHHYFKELTSRLLANISVMRSLLSGRVLPYLPVPLPAAALHPMFFLIPFSTLS